MMSITPPEKSGSSLSRGDPPRTGLFLPAGTLVSIAKADDPRRLWRAHRTRRSLTFASEYRTKHVRGSSGAVIFREGEWLILTRWNRIRRIRQ